MSISKGLHKSYFCLAPAHIWRTFLDTKTPANWSTQMESQKFLYPYQRSEWSLEFQKDYFQNRVRKKKCCLCGTLFIIVGVIAIIIIVKIVKRN